MKRRRFRLPRAAIALAVVFGLAGLHIRTRPTNTPNTSTTRTPDADGGPTRTRTHGGSSAPVSRQQGDLTRTATGPTARPKEPGAPNPPRTQMPRGGQRITEDGQTITIDRDRDKPDVNWTSGYAENLAPPTQNDDGSWNINLRMHEGWNQSDFDVKSQYLQGLGNDDQLRLQTGEGDDRSSRVDSWRNAKERELFYGAQNQEEFDAGLAELDNSQIDHAHELQLGGRDEHANMWALESGTNHGMGGQINSQLSSVRSQMRELGYSDDQIIGTLIRVDIVPGTYSPD